MERVPFINFGYVEGYKANMAYNIRNFVHSIRNAGLTRRWDYKDGIGHYKERRILVCYEGAYYDIAQDVDLISPDGYLEGNKERQRELKMFLLANFPNFPEN